MIRKLLYTLSITITIAILLSCYIKVGEGNLLHFQTHNDTVVGGPFEASNSTSRYALIQAIVDNQTFFLTPTQARFSAPDVALYKGEFISLFTPGVSFIAIPLYILGKLMGLPQLITFLLNPFIALVNILLITIILRKLKFSFITGVFSGMVFVFATNMLPYTFTLTQHGISTCLVLLGLLNVLEERTWMNNFALGILFGAGALVDIPNVFFFIPILVYAVYKHITHTLSKKEKLVVSIKTSLLGLLIGLIPLVLVFGIYNFDTTGSYTKLAQFIGRTNYFSATTQNTPIPIAPIVKTSKGSLPPIGKSLPFETRLQLNGFYTLLISDERAWIYYCPVVLFGILGLFILYRNKTHKAFAVLIISIILLNIVMYAMFGDPWGGWAFGPRYLLPSAGLLSLAIGPVLERYKKNIFLIAAIFLLLTYSVYINSLGALTTTAIPPKVEAQNLPTHIPYTPDYNRQFIQRNQTYSLVYNNYLASSITLSSFLSILSGGIVGMFALLYVGMLLEQRRELK